MLPTRRTILATLPLLPLTRGIASAQDEAARLHDAQGRLAEIERGLGGRIGVAAVETSSGLAFLHRAQEAFPMCSTFKLLLAAAILTRVDAGAERLDRRIAYGTDDLLSYAPVTRAALEAGGPEAGSLSLEALCAATMVWSDNTAANLLLGVLGGPGALTAFCRGLGDSDNRLDRNEPDLNSAEPGDPRDTTNPSAFVADLRALLLGPALTAQNRARLEGWMVASRTGTRRLRAGLPASWTVGDKTGSGDHGTANVVAILRPPARAPILAAVFLTGSGEPAEALDTAHTQIGRLVASVF